MLYLLVLANPVIDAFTVANTTQKVNYFGDITTRVNLMDLDVVSHIHQYLSIHVQSLEKQYNENTLFFYFSPLFIN